MSPCPARSASPLVLLLARPILPVLLALLALFFLGLLPGCGGRRVTGDHVDTANLVLAVSPPAFTLTGGQSVQFTARSPWGTRATWSVQPAAGGSITDRGLFTASSQTGRYTIVAMWQDDVRYTATAEVTILPPPAATSASPALVMAGGTQQIAPGTTLHNVCTVAEPLQATTARDPAGTLQVRHGFTLPNQAPSN